MLLKSVLISNGKSKTSMAECRLPTNKL